MTPAELTALLAPVRALLDRLDPHQDRAYVTLAVAALGMLRELRESQAISVRRTHLEEGAAELARDWNDRADELIAGAFPGWKPPS
jgi:hypothetical protein